MKPGPDAPSDEVHWTLSTRSFKPIFTISSSLEPLLDLQRDAQSETKTQ